MNIRSLIQQEAQAILAIPDDNPFEAVVDQICAQVHEQEGKVMVSGIGKAGHIGMKFASTLSSTGTPAVFLHPSEAQHGDLGMLQPQDALFLISNSGKTREILELAHLARQLYPQMVILALTGHDDSPIQEVASPILRTGNPGEICPLGLTPTTSCTVMTVICDVLVVMLMNRIGFEPRDYAHRHHSGYLGRKARGEGA
ncbi:MAG: SIS domain-containing protein [Bacteroidota bacterium]